MNTHFKIWLPLVGLLSLSFAVGTSTAAEWGSIKGRLVFEGKAGTPEPINVTKDVEYCSQHPLVQETIEVGEKGGLKNAFVYLYLGRSDEVEIHPDLKETEETAVLDNHFCRFEPHALLVRTEQDFEIKNGDTVGHNTNFGSQQNPGFNETIAASGSTTKVMQKSEAYPVPVTCNIHPWMKGYVLVRDNPYMAVSGEDGSFEIKNLPAGKHTFIIWHEAAARGVVSDLAMAGGKTDRRGRVNLTVPAGDVLDLGEIKVPAKALGK